MVNVLFSNFPSKKGMSYVTYPVRERVKAFELPNSFESYEQIHYSFYDLFNVLIISLSIMIG